MSDAIVVTLKRVSAISLYWIVLGALVVGCGRVGFDSTATSSTDSAFDANRGGDAAVGLTTVTVAAASEHTCATRRGRLACWGDNSAGQLGVGDQVQRSAPATVSGADWVEVQVGGSFSCGRKATGAVLCWGSNSNTQLGALTPAASSVPLLVALPAAARAISCGDRHACAVLETGRIWCWGDNREGQLGLHDSGAQQPSAPPSKAETVQNWTSVAAGQGHTLALASTTLFGTGRNTSGELGSSAVAGQYRTLTTFSSVAFVVTAPGSNYTQAIDSQARLFGWGSNGAGQLGTGDRLNVAAPQLIDETRAWRTIATDTFHSCAIDTSGNLYCWGRSIEGQLGNGSNGPDLLIATPSGSDKTWTSVSVGRFYTCAVATDQSIWCTGDNSAGKLGLGDTQRRAAWTMVAF